MPHSDTPRFDPRDIFTALGLLSRLPVPGDDARGAASAWAWPLAGLAVALPAALIAGTALHLGLSGGAAAGLALLAQCVLTGALHEDGLADSADGFWGGWEKPRRLEIMKDSHIGTYGVLALILITLLRWQALASLFSAGHVLVPLLIAAALSRAPMAVVMAALPNARGTGLSQSVGQPPRQTALAACILALAIAVLLAGFGGALTAVPVALTTLAVMAIARAKIGGQTGDVLGATQQLTDCAALLVLSVGLG